MKKYRLDFINSNNPDDNVYNLYLKDFKYILLRFLDFGFDTFDKELNDLFGLFPVYDTINIYSIVDGKCLNFMFIDKKDFHWFCFLAGFLLEVLNEKK